MCATHTSKPSPPQLEHNLGKSTLADVSENRVPRKENVFHQSVWWPPRKLGFSEKDITFLPTQVHPSLVGWFWVTVCKFSSGAKYPLWQFFFLAHFQVFLSPAPLLSPPSRRWVGGGVCVVHENPSSWCSCSGKRGRHDISDILKILDILGEAWHIRYSENIRKC